MGAAESVTRAVLVTGSSTGIGAACALALERRGFRVFAGVRRVEDGQQLQQRASPRLSPVMIDVTDGASIAAAAVQLQQALGEPGLWGLVNNAGIVVSGPLELLPLEQWRRQFEVNVIGHVAVTQAMLPLLRAARGRIVNIGSLNGALSTPFLGPYCASKFALEAVSDALRLELRKWGILVSLVEPGPIATPIWEKSTAAADELAGVVPQEALDQYQPELDIFRRKVQQVAAGAEPADRVVAAVLHALSAPRPKIRYFLRFRTRFCFKGLKMAPDRLRDWIVRRDIGLP